MEGEGRIVCGKEETRGHMHEGGREREEGVKETEEVRETEEGVREREGAREREDTRYASPALPLPHSHSEHHSANIKVR